MAGGGRLDERAANRPADKALWHVDGGWALFAGPLNHNESHAHSTAVYLAGLYGPFSLRVAGSGWQTRGWKGTIPYAAPEMFNGAAAPGTDQYALAVTFCQLVMGERAFYKSTPRGTRPTGPPIDMTKLRDKEFPIIARALHPYPSSRWPSCKAFIQALRKVVEGKRASRSLKAIPRGIQDRLARLRG